MSLRILGGKYRGRLLQAPRTSHTRPTTSMLRKAVFDILQTVIDDTTFLDLFAGSGAMGIEALSHGAKHVTLVENHRDALRCIRHNLAALQLASQAVLYPLDVFETLKKLEKRGQTFDIIYADPPYHKASFYLELLTYLDSSPLMTSNGLLFLESPAPSPFKNPTLLHFSLVDQRRFGTSLLHQYCYTL